MKNLIGVIARALVDNPEQILVVEVEEDHTIVLAFRLSNGLRCLLIPFLSLKPD
jgi:predicted RNA-binding protein YlqC (UPF0109 family)